MIFLRGTPAPHSTRALSRGWRAVSSSARAGSPVTRAHRALPPRAPLPPSLMQSRIRCTAQRCQAVSQKTSSIALTSPLWVSDATSSVPEARRSRCACKKPGHESYDSVSAIDTPGTRLQPESFQPIAVAAAVDATRFHLT